MLALRSRAREFHASWAAFPGLGVRVSDINRPEPDVLVIPRAGSSLAKFWRDRNDIILAFEVLSPSTQDRDLRWKRAAYTSIPSLTHYVVIAQDAIDVVVFARDFGFAERRIRSLEESLDLPSLGISVPLSEIYDDIEWIRAR
jgi:Uma2 family endonuclease